jgi:hypothetical protein
MAQWTTGEVRTGQDWWWVAVIEDGDGNREASDPFEARDLLEAWAMACLEVIPEYDARCKVIDVTQDDPMLDPARKS